MSLTSHGTGRDEDGEPPMHVPMRKHRLRANIRPTRESYRPKLVPEVIKPPQKSLMLHTKHLLKEEEIVNKQKKTNKKMIEEK